MQVLRFKRTGCNLIEIPHPSGRDIENYAHTAVMCATITKDLELFTIENRFTDNIIKEYNEIW